MWLRLKVKTVGNGIKPDVKIELQLINMDHITAIVDNQLGKETLLQIGRDDSISVMESLEEIYEMIVSHEMLFRRLP